MGRISSDLLVPCLFLLASCTALAGKRDVYSLLVAGAQSGLETALHMAPSLIVLLSAISMLRASGALDLMTEFLAPVFRLAGLPPETAPLVLIRPLSGSAALAVGAEIMSAYGVDSLIGRTAAVMLGSTETTFYTISVYCGAAGIRHTRYLIPAALIADGTGFCLAALTVRWFF